MMKKVISLLLALLMTAAVIMLSGCNEKKSNPKATQATDVPDAVLSTVSPAELKPLTEQGGDTEAYHTVYGGMTGQEAILEALGYVGAGYQCVSFEKRYLRNDEAWYIGIRASNGSDDTVYHLYVNKNRCVPQQDIPTLGGKNRKDEGVFEENYAGISEQEAIFKAVGMAGDYVCVSSEQTEKDGTEYWRIGVQKTDESDSEIMYYYVNKDECF